MNRQRWETNPENYEAVCDGCGVHLKYGGYEDGDRDWCGECVDGSGAHAIHIRVKLKQLEIAMAALRIYASDRPPIDRSVTARDALGEIEALEAKGYVPPR